MRIVKDTIKLIEMMELWDKANGGYIKFNLWDCQKELLDKFHSEKKIIGVKKRQVGVSQLAGADSLAQCMLLPNFLVLVLSKTGDDAEEFLRRVHDMYHRLPDSFKKACPLVKDNADVMEFSNGSRIKSLPAKKGAGLTADRVIIDEGAYVTISESKISLEEVLMRVEPTLDKAGGQLIMISTANGYNLYQKYYHKAKRGLSSWKPYFIGCYSDPTFTREKRAQIIKDFGEDHANQEYPEFDHQAFLMSGRLRFHKDALKEMIEKHQLEGENGFLHKVATNKCVFKGNSEGWLRIFKHPERNKRYVLGADVCEGIEIEGISESKNKSDFNGVHVLDAITMEQVAVMHNRLEPDVLAEEIARLAVYYNNAFVGVERNNDGKTCLSALKKLYSHLYFQENFDSERQVRGTKLGWNTTAQSKRILVSFGAKCIREMSAIIHCPDTLGECMTFVQNTDGSCNAQDSCHDDLVMGWLIALQMCLAVPLENVDLKEFNYNEIFDYKQSTSREKEVANYFGR